MALVEGSFGDDFQEEFVAASQPKISVRVVNLGDVEEENEYYLGTIPLVVPHFLDATKSILYAVTPSDF